MNADKIKCQCNERKLFVKLMIGMKTKNKCKWCGKKVSVDNSNYCDKCFTIFACKEMLNGQSGFGKGTD